MNGKIPDGKYIAVIGAANMDINCYSAQPLNMGDSNPGHVEYCLGGVGRNIAENLLKLGAEVQFISIFGDDHGGALLQNRCREGGLDTSHSLIVRGGVSPVYAAVIDASGEMKVAVADMDILEKMSAAHLKAKAELLAGSAAIVIEANFPEEVIRFVLETWGATVPVFFDAVSERKAAKAKKMVGLFDTVKMNRDEAEILSGIKIEEKANPDDALLSQLGRAGAFFAEAGCRAAYITLGKNGLYYHGRDDAFYMPVKPVKPVNTSGGGDAFTAGIVYGTVAGFSPRETARLAAVMAALTVQSRDTVSQNISPGVIVQTLGER